MENSLVTMEQMCNIERAGAYIAKSGLFGVKTPEQAIALMLVAQSEGRNPMEAARDYHIITAGGLNRPSLKADAILARFQQAGGSVEWLEFTDAKVAGQFSHPQGGSLVVDWTIERAKQAGLADKDLWKKYPRAMLRSRVISEGVRTVYPGACSGIYTKEEVEDMVEPETEPEMEVKMSEPKKAEAQETVIIDGEQALKEEAKNIIEDRAIFRPRQKELWQKSQKNWAKFVDLLKNEPLF